jgi:hypothetical protein
MRVLLPFLALPLLAACATALPPVEVTRFHRIDPATTAVPGPYMFELANGESLSLAARAHQAAVATELERLGFREHRSAAAMQGGYRVQVNVERLEGPPAQSPGGVNVGVGGGTGGYRSGVGVGVGLDLTSLFRDRRDIILTRLTVSIRRQREEMALWEGRAENVARSGTPAAQPNVAAAKLATALFADFPGRSGETITVE